MKTSETKDINEILRNKRYQWNCEKQKISMNFLKKIQKQKISMKIFEKQKFSKKTKAVLKILETKMLKVFQKKDADSFRNKGVDKIFRNKDVSMFF